MRINSEYNIETIKPGHTCKLLNINEDQTTFSNNMQIVSVAYSPVAVTLELAEFRTSFGEELQKFVTNSYEFDIQARLVYSHKSDDNYRKRKYGLEFSSPNCVDISEIIKQLCKTEIH